MGFGQGVSGLKAAATNLDVIGNNIANANTVGFKQSKALFSDVYAGSRIGLGVRANSVVQAFSGGTPTFTGRQLDLAISNGNGFFRLQGADGGVFYSRDGQLQRQDDGRLVHLATGMQVTGYPAGSNGLGAPQPLVLSNAQMPPRAATQVTAQMQLDSRGTVPVNPFASAPGALPDSTMFNYRSPVVVHDSLGNARQLNAYFAKSAAPPGVPGGTDWNVYVTDEAGNTLPGMPVTLSFDNAGVMQSTTPANPTLTLAALNGAAPLTVDFDMTGTTQYRADNETKMLDEDGYASGGLLAYSIEKDGTIVGRFSNDKTMSLGQIAMATFGNLEGLNPEGNNIWSATGASGQELLGVAGGSMGTLEAGNVEASNVDMSAQLVDLIVAQRTYQANAQTIKAQDTVLQTLVNL
ncbi:flagellar hook protein FlgE [Cupriavidus pauculus]|uniref:flagellar hook protein FlgE n=1 Tax=Cupriavidus pauculus TaxID=82633 RepID=UPI001EE17F14|nr:flagellar hook protein FlgE [Cupriavidus pauculus]GJG93791.1 flagellar hook protein FlgE [Cupriavidus pauculus]